MPCSWVAKLAPESALHARAAAAALNENVPSLCALSRDPGATEQEILKGIAILSAFLSAWLFATSGNRRSIFWGCAWSSVVMSLVALAHAMFQIDEVFGLYKPVGLHRELLLAPLMNPNHLGGFVAMGVPLWIGLTYRDPSPGIRLLGYSAIAVCATTTALSMSRGAIGELLASTLFIGWLVLTHRGKDLHADGKALRRIGLVAALALGLGAGAYLVGEQLGREFAARDIGKFELISRGLRFAGNHLWVGVGRGAFSSVFVAIEGQTTRYVYPENFVVQWLSEWGLPVTLMLVLAAGSALLQAMRTTTSLAHFGAITALCSLVAQNLVDFGLEELGVAVVAAVLLAACVAPSASPDAAVARGLRRVSSLVIATLLGGLVGLCLLGPGLQSHQVRALNTRLRDLMASGDRVSFKRVLSHAMSVHPSEPGFALLGAEENVRHADAASGRWLNRAMQLAPGWAAPHALAFRWLWQRGRRSQALLELRAAAEVDPRANHDDLCRLAQANPLWALTAAPLDTVRRRVYLESITLCIPPEHPSEVAIDDVLMREFPDSPLARERRAWRLHLLGRTQESLAMVDNLLRTHPALARVHVMRALILLAAERPREVIDEVNRAIAILDESERGQLLTLRAMASAQIGDPALVQSAIAQLRRVAGADMNQLAESYAVEGRAMLTLNRPGEAFVAFREAYRINQDTRHLEDLARLAESLGDRPQALWAYMRLCEREPRGGSCVKRDQLRGPSVGDTQR
jgi:tetratricopeptide (TPR) repeat protein